ncbi:MAG: zinc carboxypeptidase [Saprospiraceae bacterium]|nr:zinc carboxypeptidase [Saprospiraceae bacterium]
MHRNLMPCLPAKVIQFAKYLLIGGAVSLSVQVMGQQPALSYYLPDISYDPQITTPAEFLGHEVGAWHVSHDRLYQYMLQLARESDRISVQEYARTYEARPLLLLTVTSAENQRNIEAIRTRHLAWCDPDQHIDFNQEKLPTVLYQGFSIHGNEPSGANAGMLLAYYLAAGQSQEVLTILDQVVVLFDPCFNPDGLQRFSGWVNSYRGQELVADPASEELHEPWPGGRTNHYWFDLNRDWMLLQHPESRGRVANFYAWRPNILTDHHEMGSNSSFFFMPGDQRRVHPLTPKRNQELTFAIADYHVKALDSIGSLYFSQQNYDDYYYGKGSSYPDMNGCVGILFEQASARGHLRETDNGLLSFPFAIRNHVNTGISTYRAAVGLRKELLEYQRQSFIDNVEEAKNFPVKAYVFQDKGDPVKVNRFIQQLSQQQIKIYHLNKPVTVNGVAYGEQAYIIPMEQTQYRVIRGLFETITHFEDSIFYDISTWTMPLAYNLQYATLDAKSFAGNLIGELASTTMPAGSIHGGQASYAYLIPWEGYFAPAVAYQLLEKGLHVRVNDEPLEGMVGMEKHRFAAGTLILPVPHQAMGATAMHHLVDSLCQAMGVDAYALNSGYTHPINLGSPNTSAIHLPRIALVIGEGIYGNDAGEIWFMLDHRFRIPVTLISSTDFNRLDLNRYTTLIIPDGSPRISQSGIDKLKEWVRGGGTLLNMEGAALWATSNGLAKVSRKKLGEEEDLDLPYGELGDYQRTRYIAGAIMQATMDLTHPLAFGYTRDKLPVFRRGNTLFDLPGNKNASPITYTDHARLSGYVPATYLPAMDGSAEVIVNQLGRGKVINYADDLNFRAFWYGTTKLMMNGIFFGSMISSNACERVGE